MFVEIFIHVAYFGSMQGSQINLCFIPVNFPGHYLRTKAMQFLTFPSVLL